MLCNAKPMTFGCNMNLAQGDVYMDNARFDLLIRLYDMGKLLHKSVGLLADKPDDALTENTVRQVANTMHSFYESDGFNLLEDILSESETRKAERLHEFQNAFLDGFNKTIYRELSNLLEQDTYIEQSIAERLFRFFEQEGYQSSESASLLFSLCNKSAVSTPLESFQFSVKLFEAYPNMLSGEDTAHPGYVYKSSEQRTFKCCPICGEQGIPYYRALSYRMSHFSHPHLPVKLWMRCTKCKNLYTWKFPEEYLALSEHHARIYPDTDKYLTTCQGTSGGVLSIWSDILNKLRSLSSGSDLLEVGVGTGELLAVALEMGIKVDAVEISPNSAHKIADMLNISVWMGDFLNFESDRCYDIITMGDVIEHVTDPTKALKNAHTLLKDDGVLWLSTPNFESSFSRMLKFNDPMWLEPYHISYFSYHGLEQLANDCGFEVHEYKVSNRYNGSMELILKKHS